MEVIESGTPIETGPCIGREYGRIRRIWERIKLEVWWWRLNRWIPRLVWLHDEVDVRVTFKDIGALGGDPGAVWEAQDAFRKMGIGFDTGSGCHGRDWEWDFCLNGPISVTFKGRAKHPERRILKQMPPKPKLVA